MSKYPHKHKSNGVKRRLWRANIRALKADLKEEYDISFEKNDPNESKKMWSRV